jgi:pyridoxamine 5'-phosphate oxidase-like protein
VESAAPRAVPRARRVDIPDRKEYGKWTDEQLAPVTWDEARARLIKTGTFWLITVGTNGRPRAAAVWANWFEERFYILMQRDTISARNVERNDQALVHLADVKEVLIVEGTMRRRDAAELPSGLVAGFKEKYDYDLDPTDADLPVYELMPRVVRSWHGHDFRGTAMRFDFTEHGAEA